MTGLFIREECTNFQTKRIVFPVRHTFQRNRLHKMPAGHQRIYMDLNILCITKKHLELSV